jgi:hypothetical protein
VDERNAHFIFMFLAPLGERLGEGVGRAHQCVTPSPVLSPKRGEEKRKSDP